MGSDLVKRFLSKMQWLCHDDEPEVQEAAARITALEAMCEKMAGYAEHDSDCVLSIPKAIRVRSSIQDKCSCGLSETLAQYREADDGR